MRNIPEMDRPAMGRRGMGVERGSEMHHHEHRREHDWAMGEHGHGFFEGGHFGGRARRGEMRYVLMDALRSGPKHGYEIVKALEERSGGQYVPSPGTVYPTMQALQEEGFVSAEQDGDRRVFSLTDAGKVELEAHATEVEGFWARFEVHSVAQASRHEMAFLEDEMESLRRTIWGGLGDAISRGDQETIRRVREAVVRCRDEVRNIVSNSAA
jgi:DNA-binding PadR family transcriptional regulator